MLQAPSFSPRPDAEALRDDAWIVPLLLLRRHNVDHVVIGDAAAAAYGERPPGPVGLTVVPASYGRNLDRLAEARKAIAEQGAAVEIEHRPDGTDGYHDLHDDARPVRIGDVEVLVASSEDLARIRAAATPRVA
ncbi:MAG TPA: hypothetical protein VF533_18260 [Solirubrobacteraceae bacterium]|jgi:hypothetical protein